MRDIYILELMETNTFKRFTSCLEMIFDSSEELDFTIELGKMYSVAVLHIFLCITMCVSCFNAI